MTHEQYSEYMTRTGIKITLLALLVILVLALCFGCASREPSSTDNHPTVPKWDCHYMRTPFDRQMHNVCCDESGQHCVIAKD